jgi:hypothetical protein
MSGDITKFGRSQKLYKLSVLPYSKFRYQFNVSGPTVLPYSKFW